MVEAGDGKRGRCLTFVRLLAPGPMALALAAAATLAPSPSRASTHEGPLPSVVAQKPLIATITPPAPDDGLAGGGFYIEADELIQNDANHTVTARGGVEARYQGRVLRADQLTYDSVSGVVTATGSVSIVNPDGTAEFSRSAILDKSMSQGVALAFSSRLKDHVTVAAASAVRRSKDYQELNEVIFTPCPVCAKEPTPTWSIRARKAVEDKKRQTIYFRDAVIEVRGIPVFYAPVLWQPDPAVPRKSGLHIPDIGVSGKRGVSWEQPYLQVISPSEDMVISPQINTKVNPFLNVDWRRRFWSVNASLTGTCSGIAISNFIPDSSASTAADKKNFAGTKMTEILAPVASTADCIVS